MKILVADDSKTTLTMIIDSLNRLGHDVMPAANGEEAIQLFQNERPDLIILDVVMEGIDGFECARKLRAINPEDWIPIIFLSATVDDQHIYQGINAGGDDYLTKPYSEITLAAKINAMQRISDMRKKLFSMTTELSMLSTTDALTGIPNRLSFDKTIIEKFSNVNRYNKLLALLFIDLDNFKTINDTLGHHVGDLLLKEVSLRLKSSLRIDDYIARLGGDEFAIILTDFDNTRAPGEIAKKLIQVIAPTYHLIGNDLNIGASIGIACYAPKDDMTIELLEKNADIAMYRAKELGRNNFQYYNSELNIKHNQQVTLENALKKALENKEIFILYQPIFDLTTKEITRLEVLAHWKNSILGEQLADFFLPLAEHIGLIDLISNWILQTACKQSATWADHGHEVKLSINLTPRQLLQKDFIELISNILAEHHLASTSIELELIETSPLIYTDSCKNIINRLSAHGIGITLDNFGTGYSSLSHLRSLKINSIKINKTFIYDAVTHTDSSVLIKSIISLGNNLGFDVIVDGIKTHKQLKFLIDVGGTQGQGDYLCSPQTTEQMTKLLEKKHSVRSV